MSDRATVSTASAAEDFDYRLRRRARGARPGLHRGTEAGAGFETLSHESLLDARDPRRLDKLASARDPLRRLLVRRYRQHASVCVYLLADLSASIGFRASGDRLATLAAFTAALGRSASRAGDPFAFFGCADRLLDEFVQPLTRTRGAALAIAERLRAFTPSGRSAGALLDAAAQVARREALVFLASDFHFPLTLLDRVLAALARHHVVPVVLADSGEALPPSRFGIARILDLESGERRMLLLRPGLRERFAERAAAHRDALARRFESHGIAPLRLTDRFDADDVTAYFHR